jgi:cephalosporin-C deacetylase-like acetyl esterase
MASLNRREFARRAGALACAAGVSPFGAVFAAQPRSYTADLPNMLLAYFGQQFNAVAAHWDEVRNGIRTPEEVEARNRFVREKMREMVHGFPERNPLNPVVTATLERSGYRVENVMFQSRPNFWVTGNLYIPTSGKGPFPGIISPCGHYELARMQPDYQFAYLNLVKSGFVVLGYDPIGLGERRQYWNPYTRRTEDGLGATYEHSMPGQVLLLMGEDLTHYRIWDGMRAIDYLLTRPEVDGKRIGCAGHSGGGTLTRFIAALDERVQCAVISEGGSADNRWHAGTAAVRTGGGGSLGPADVEQNLFPAAVYGVDNTDMCEAVAPRPLLALIENFSPRFDAGVQHIRTRYQQLGAADKFAAEEATDPHAWTVKLRLATTDWFSRWFYGRRGPDREPDFQAEPEQALYCTPNGSIRYSQQGDTIFSLILKKQQSLPPKREVPRGAAGRDAFRREMVSQITSLLRYRKSGQDLGVRHLVTTPRKGYQIEKLEFLSEPGIFVPVWAFLPESKPARAQAILYVDEAGKEADGLEFGPLEALARKGHLVIAVDVRGVGGTLAARSGQGSGPFAHLFDADTALTYMSWSLDESLFGMRVQDVVRSVDYVLSRPDVDKGGLRVIGKGAGALWALYAAALDERITAVVAQGGLISYGSLARVDRYLHGAQIFVRDVLKSFDLPQVAGAVADRRLVLLGLTDPMKNPVPAASALRAYEWTRQAYANAGASDRFEIRTGVAGPDEYPQLLGMA